MKLCTNAACQAVNAPEANFCSLCRTPFERTKGAYCDKGHAMHPSWKECLECHGDRSQDQDFRSVPPRTPTVVMMEDPVSSPSPRGSTVIELSPQPSHPAAPYVSPPVPPPASPQTTASMVPQRVAGPSALPPGAPAVAPATPRSKTVFGSAQPSANPEAVPPARARTGGAEYEVKAPQAAAAAVEALPAYVQGKKTERRIIGVLLTYTWRPEGQIFPICEGRNRIGRSDECEIQLPEDSHLSGLNTHITYRKNFKIGDLVSMGGTDLNGEPVEDTNVHLPNYAQIRAGSTHFTFIAADPAFAAA